MKQAEWAQWNADEPAPAQEAPALSEATPPAEMDEPAPQPEAESEPEPVPQPEEQPENQPPLDAAALAAENRLLQTQLFASERVNLALQKENDELTAQCKQLRAQNERLRAQLASRAAAANAAASPAPTQQTVQEAETQLDRLSAQLLDEFDRILPR